MITGHTGCVRLVPVVLPAVSRQPSAVSSRQPVSYGRGGWFAAGHPDVRGNQRGKDPDQDGQRQLAAPWSGHCGLGLWTASRSRAWV